MQMWIATPPADGDATRRCGERAGIRVQMADDGGEGREGLAVGVIGGAAVEAEAGGERGVGRGAVGGLAEAGFDQGGAVGVLDFDAEAVGGGDGRVGRPCRGRRRSGPRR